MICKLECIECGFKWECVPETEHKFKRCPHCNAHHSSFKIYYVHDLRREEEKSPIRW